MTPLQTADEKAGKVHQRERRDVDESQHYDDSHDEDDYKDDDDEASEQAQGRSQKKRVKNND